MSRTFALRRVALLAVSSLALAALPACQSSGVEQSEATQATMSDFKTQVQQFKDNLKATVASLDGIQKQAKVDPKTEFANYQTHLAATIKSGEQARATVEQMKKRGQAYFASWEQSAAAMTNEDIRKISDERRGELRKHYDELQATLTQVADEAKPLRAQLESLQTYYSNDLTPAGIDASKSLVSKAKDSAEDLIEKLDDIGEAVDKVAEQLKVAKPPPPPPPQPAK